MLFISPEDNASLALKVFAVVGAVIGTIIVIGLFILLMWLFFRSINGLFEGLDQIIAPKSGIGLIEVILVVGAIGLSIEVITRVWEAIEAEQKRRRIAGEKELEIRMDRLIDFYKQIDAGGDVGSLMDQFFGN